MRPPSQPIYAPWLDPGLRWVNARRVMMHELRGGPVLVEFWDFCRPNSLRTLPYVKRWHQRYAERGLSVLGIHSPGFPPSRDPDAVRAAVARLGIKYPVALDCELQVFCDYGNLGWPARYLFDGELRLFEHHYGEGAYAETEASICELLGLSAPAFEALRPEDEPGALLEFPGALAPRKPGPSAEPSDQPASPQRGPADRASLPLDLSPSSPATATAHRDPDLPPPPPTTATAHRDPDLPPPPPAGGPAPEDLATHVDLSGESATEAGAPDARVSVLSSDTPVAEVPGSYSGPYVAGGVWAVLDGSGLVKANDRWIAVEHPGAYELICHRRSTLGELRLEIGDGVRCHAVCFTPGLA